MDNTNINTKTTVHGYQNNNFFYITPTPHPHVVYNNICSGTNTLMGGKNTMKYWKRIFTNNEVRKNILQIKSPSESG